MNYFKGDGVAGELESDTDGKGGGYENELGHT